MVELRDPVQVGQQPGPDLNRRLDADAGAKAKQDRERMEIVHELQTRRDATSPRRIVTQLGFVDTDGPLPGILPPIRPEPPGHDHRG